MKKILLITITILMIINLIGCQSQEVAKYNFEYKFKPEYSDKISSGLAGAFIDMTKDVEKIYLTAFENFEVTELEEEFLGYAGDVCLAYNGAIDNYNEHEKELIELMISQWDNVVIINMLKTSYEEDKVNESIGLKTEHTESYYESNLERTKEKMEESFELVKKFIN